MAAHLNKKYSQKHTLMLKIQNINPILVLKKGKNMQ